MPYRLWALRLWRVRARVCVVKTHWLNALPPRAVSYVFARLGPNDRAIALDVAGDEGSGVDWTTDPRSWRTKPYCTGSANGQYLGCFQMGDWARGEYGHGPTALDQAWAAFRYRTDPKTGSGWCSGWAATANVCRGAVD